MSQDSFDLDAKEVEITDIKLDGSQLCTLSRDQYHDNKSLFQKLRKKFGLRWSGNHSTGFFLWRRGDDNSTQFMKLLEEDTVVFLQTKSTDKKLVTEFNSLCSDLGGRLGYKKSKPKAQVIKEELRAFDEKWINDLNTLHNEALSRGMKKHLFYDNKLKDYDSEREDRFGKGINKKKVNKIVLTDERHQEVYTK